MLNITETMQIAIIGAMGVVILILIAAVIRNEIRMKRFLRGAGAHTLEDTLRSLHTDIRSLEAQDATLTKRLDHADAQLGVSIQRVGLLRFNPFKGTSGSNQSFALALLTKSGDGIVVSSLYSRDRVSVFAKPLKNKVSEYDLTEEERDAIDKALTMK